MCNLVDEQYDTRSNFPGAGCAIAMMKTSFDIVVNPSGSVRVGEIGEAALPQHRLQHGRRVELYTSQLRSYPFNFRPRGC